jgi:hypothetical protein
VLPGYDDHHKEAHHDDGEADYDHQEADYHNGETDHDGQAHYDYSEGDDHDMENYDYLLAASHFHVNDLDDAPLDDDIAFDDVNNGAIKHDPAALDNFVSPYADDYEPRWYPDDAYDAVIHGHTAAVYPSYTRGY